MRFGLTVATLFAVLRFALANPLATDDQRQLDELSMKLAQSSEFDELRGKAYEQWYQVLNKYNVNIDSAIKQDVDNAIKELVFSSVQKAVNNDPAHPKVYWVDTAPRHQNWFGLDVPGGRYSYDNPDCFYRTIPISDKYTYKIHGRRYGSGPADVSFSLISSMDSQNTVASLAGKDIEYNDDGSYTITVNNQDSNDKNHIKSTWNGVQLFIRNNIGDWSQELPDTLSVEIVGNVTAEPHSEQKIIEDAKTSLKWSTFFYGYGALDFKTFSVGTNNLQSPSQSQSLGTLTTQAQSFAPYKLNDNQALVITITPGNAKYWVVPVYTVGLITVAPWENLISYNNKQARANSDGSYTFVLSKNDPGVYNWLNTTGRPEGTLMPRFQGLPASDKGAKGITIKHQLVDFNKLGSVLPNGTSYVSASERQQQVQERIAGYERLHQQ
ncbi:hypothetical protein MCUN1_001369 [Malassezia cuniculi]|uniref:DUF1214 domain-containing protein n=1 Tax=Malassezia cuniculi TaxID=948313 RepID=A0AAF0J5S3_9BASI|nr:hypothetical protein MCUN1_001369 [Malassezia cuniculi]